MIKRALKEAINILLVLIFISLGILIIISLLYTLTSALLAVIGLILVFIAGYRLGSKSSNNRK